MSIFSATAFFDSPVTGSYLVRPVNRARMTLLPPLSVVLPGMSGFSGSVPKADRAPSGSLVPVLPPVLPLLPLSSLPPPQPAIVSASASGITVAAIQRGLRMGLLPG